MTQSFSLWLTLLTLLCVVILVTIRCFCLCSRLFFFYWRIIRKLWNNFALIDVIFWYSLWEELHALWALNNFTFLSSLQGHTSGNTFGHACTFELIIVVIISCGTTSFTLMWKLTGSLLLYSPILISQNSCRLRDAETNTFWNTHGFKFIILIIRISFLIFMNNSLILKSCLWALHLDLLLIVKKSHILDFTGATKLSIVSCMVFSLRTVQVISRCNYVSFIIYRYRFHDGLRLFFELDFLLTLVQIINFYSHVFLTSSMFYWTLVIFRMTSRSFSFMILFLSSSLLLCVVPSSSITTVFRSVTVFLRWSFISHVHHFFD